MHNVNDPIEKYSIGSRILHWLIALIVLCMLPMGYLLDDLSKGIKPTALMLHKSFGITIIFLLILRIIILIKNGKPMLPNSIPDWQKLISRIVHFLLYLFLFIMPLAGWIMSMAANKVPEYFGLFYFPLPGIQPDKHLAKFMFDIHSTVAGIIIFLVALHTAAALKHHFIDKDVVLKRML